MGKSIEEINRQLLKEKFRYGLPDYLVVDMSRPIGEMSRKSWIDYLQEKEYMEEKINALDYYKQFQIHCDYCRKYNIPNIED